MRVPNRRSEGKSSSQSKVLCSLSCLTRLLPALRARRAAARGEEELQQHLLLAAQLQSSCHCPHGCFSPYGVHDSRWFEGESSAEKRTLPSPRSVPSSPPRLQQSSAARYPFEFFARSLVYIEAVLGPASGPKGGGRLSVGESRRHRMYQKGALFRSNPLQYRLVFTPCCERHWLTIHRLAVNLRGLVSNNLCSPMR